MKIIKKNELTVVDFFCWAWGFSEGFRQQWFKIIKWLDYWQPAIDTHNLNHNLNDTPKNILDFWNEDSSNINEINNLENSDIIIWSPACVSFSTSNKWWKADKSLWIQLIESFLRVIAVKKHQNNSELLAWYMENVPNSQNFVYEKYTFEMLNLSKWAESIWKKPSDLALRVQKNGEILNSGDFWAPQSRKRFIAWELCKTWEFIAPVKTHDNHKTLWEVLRLMPSPKLKEATVKNKEVTDPNYWNLVLNANDLTDHFYDSWLYKIEWEMSEHLKTYNFCMWKMSFPENLDKPCRTIMATQSARTREALILKSEYNRVGDWQYRLPTIREIATCMWFPLSYQFTWSQGWKWRQIWNAVSPHLSAALAKAVRNKLWLSKIKKIDFLDLQNHNYKTINLNNFKEKRFDSPNKRLKNARFRRPILKKNNITVDLLNFEKKDEVWKEWYVKVFFWTWVNYKTLDIQKYHIDELEEILTDKVIDFKDFKNNLKKIIKEKIWDIDRVNLQNIYETDLHIVDKQNPINIRNTLHHFILENSGDDELITEIDFIPKNEIPKSQLLTIYSLWNLILN